MPAPVHIYTIVCKIRCMLNNVLLHDMSSLAVIQNWWRYLEKFSNKWSVKIAIYYQGFRSSLSVKINRWIQYGMCGHGVRVMSNNCVRPHTNLLEQRMHVGNTMFRYIYIYIYIFIAIDKFHYFEYIVIDALIHIIYRNCFLYIYKYIYRYRYIYIYRPITFCTYRFIDIMYWILKRVLLSKLNFTLSR